MTTNKQILEELRRMHFEFITMIEERTIPWYRKVYYKIRLWMDAYIRRYGKR